METADIVIVGAGFAGAATAYHLAARGVHDVLLLEREPVPGMHASGRNAALAFTVLSDPIEARLALQGVNFIASPPAAFCDEPLLQRSGSLLVARHQAGIDALHRSAGDAADLGLDCELINADEAVRRVPLLAEASLREAFWNPYDGVVDIHSLLQGYLAAARNGGARVEFGRAIRAIETDHHRVSAVVTDRGRIETRIVVNAAGGWAGELGKLAGVGARTFQPRRRHLFQTLIDTPIDRAWPFVWHNDIDTYFRPEGDGLLMSPCDATPHAAREPLLDDAAKEMLADKLARAFPRLASARIASGWACLRTFAADERFVIGPDPELAGFIWVGALGGHGMTTSYGVGRLGAQAVLGEQSPELDHFSPARLSIRSS